MGERMTLDQLRELIADRLEHDGPRVFFQQLFAAVDARSDAEPELNQVANQVAAILDQWPEDAVRS